MLRDIFISYSSDDKTVAFELCEALESAGLTCWIAPRNIDPGSSWTSSILSAVSECRIMMLIFSAKSNVSKHVMREILHAVDKGFPVFPIRIEDVLPTGGLEYCLVGVQWFDATTRPISRHVESLVAQLRHQLQLTGAPAAPAPRANPEATASKSADSAPDIYFQCGRCGQNMVVEPAAAGYDIECPSCQNAVTVPQPAGVPPEQERAVTDKIVQRSSTPPPAPTSAPALLEPKAIAELKATLATFLGPLARVLVDRALARSSSVPALLDLLAAEIDSPTDRERFLRATMAERGHQR